MVKEDAAREADISRFSSQMQKTNPAAVTHSRIHNITTTNDLGKIGEENDEGNGNVTRGKDDGSQSYTEEVKQDRSSRIEVFRKTPSALKNHTPIVEEPQFIKEFNDAVGDANLPGTSEQKVSTLIG